MVARAWEAAVPEEVQEASSWTCRATEESSENKMAARKIDGMRETMAAEEYHLVVILSLQSVPNASGRVDRVVDGQRFALVENVGSR